jgi:HK97 family phage portal protein
MGVIDKILDGYFKRKGLDPTQAPVGYLPETGLTIGVYNSQKFPKAYNSSEALYSVASLVIRKAASIPWYVYKVKNTPQAKASLARYQRMTNSPMNAKAWNRAQQLRKAAYDENAMVDDGPLAKLLKQPNEHQTQDQFIEAVMGYRILSGEANLWGNSGNNPKGRIVELQVLPTQYVEDIYTKNDVYGIDGHVIDLGAKVPIAKENLLRWKNWRPDFDPTTRIHMRGISVVEVGWNNYLMGNYGTTQLANMLQNGGSKGALSPEVVANQYKTLTDPQISKAKREINAQYNGVSNAGSIGLLAAPYKFLNFGLSAVDLDIVNVINLTVHQWCRMIGAPTVLFDAEHTSDNNYQNAMRDLVTNTIVPLLSSFRDRYNNWLVPRSGQSEGYFIDYDISGLPEMQRDLEKLVNSLARAYWLKEDEKRIEMGYEPLGGVYNTSLVGSGLGKIEDVGMDLSGADQIDPNADPDVAY